MTDILTIGDVKLDTFVVLDEASIQCQLKMPECQLCLEYGAKIVVDVVDSQVAGSAPNVAIGLSRMKFRAALQSITGPDGTRQLALRKLKDERVDTRYMEAVRGERSAYSVVLNYKGEKTLLTSHVKHAYHLPKPTPKTRWMFLAEMGPGYEMLYREVAALSKNHDVLVAINPGTIQLAEKKKWLFDVLKHTYVLFVNLEEAQLLSGQTTTEVHHLATALWKLGAKQVVITDGKNGAYSFDGQELLHCPIFPGKLVEATGAGDAFATGYLGALMSGQLHDEALRWGAVNSASVIGKVGPTAGLLTATEIRTRLKKHPGFKTKPM